MKKNTFEVLYVHILDSKRVAETIEVSATTLYEASVKFWNYIHKNNIDAVKYVAFDRKG